MEEKTLLTISIICICLGFSMLFFIYENTDVQEVENIELHLDKDVKVKGFVKEIKENNGITFIKLERKQLISVVFFNSVNVEEFTDVEIIGEVTTFNGEYEIIGKEIK